MRRFVNAVTRKLVVATVLYVAFLGAVAHADPPGPQREVVKSTALPLQATSAELATAGHSKTFPKLGLSDLNYEGTVAITEVVEIHGVCESQSIFVILHPMAIAIAHKVPGRLTLYKTVTKTNPGGPTVC